MHSFITVEPVKRMQVRCKAQNCKKKDFLRGTLREEGGPWKPFFNQS